MVKETQQTATTSASQVDQAVSDQTAQKPTISFRARGSSGTRSYTGYPSEEYLHQLRGSKRADVFDKMRRSDSKVKKVLKAVKDPIKSATWEIQAPKNATPAQAVHAEFIEHVLLKDLDPDANFKQWVSEALTCLEFGFAPFEVINKVVLNHQKFGSYIGLRRLGWRSPRTIERFNLNQAAGGGLLSITQMADGDLAANVDIDAKHLIVITLEREGDNYEGVSALRACYGAWLRKTTFLKLLAIGLEKYAVPTPVGNAPVQSGPDYDAFVDALESYTSHETNYIVLPKGWEIELKENTFDAQKVRSAVDGENMEIVDAFMTNFLELGMNGGGGAYALSNDLSDFFLSGLVHLAELLAEPINQKVIPDLIKAKYGPQEVYPQLVASGITDKAGQELAASIKSLVDGKVIIPDDKLEENMRKRFKLPPASKVGQREVTPPSPFNSITPKPVGLSEKQIQLAERDARKIISSSTDDLREAMTNGLTVMGKGLIQRLMRVSAKLAPDLKVRAVKQVEVNGIGEYKKELRESLARLAKSGIESARRDVPKAKGVQFREAGSGHQLSEFDSLTPNLKRWIDAQVELLVSTQASDLEKAILFQYTSSVSSTDSAALLAEDLEDALGKYVDGSSIVAGSGTTAAQITNLARHEFFMEPEVLEEIEAFEFVNGDPVSPICQDLAGTVFAKNDPQAQRFMPPLHHNCKSYIVPILKGERSDVETERLQPSRASLEKYITLGERKAS